MSFRRVGGLAAILLATALWMGCGQYYRPVVIPTTITPPNPANFHAVFAVSSNTSFNPNTGNSPPNIWSYFPGSAFQIDVAGDTDIGEDSMGVNPIHAAILPNNGRVFVANAGSIVPTSGTDTITAFAPAPDSIVATGLGTPFTFTLPTGSLPVFLNSTQNSAMYAANFGTGTVAVLNTIQNVVSNIVAVGPNPGVQNPVAMAEIPNGTKLYVTNQGGNSVTSFNTVDMSTNPVTGFSGTAPVWVVSRDDGQKVYVLTQGDGNLITLDTASDTVVDSQPVGAGANFILYDPHLRRLYVTNPNSGTLFIFATSFVNSSGQPVDTPQLLKAVTVPGSGCTGCSAPKAISVAALPDGSRVYVASYQLLSACAENNPTDTGSCQVFPLVTVIDAASYAVKSTVFPLTPAQSSTVPPSVPELGACIPSVPFNPGLVTLAGSPVPSAQSVRFRMSAAAAADSSRVYVSICDAGSIAIINTTTSTISTGGSNTSDNLVNDLSAPFGVCTNTPTCTGEPPPQTPIFLLRGQ